MVAKDGMVSSPVEYWKVRLLGIPVIVNCPLYPLSIVPLVFVVSLTFLTVTESPILRSCGLSAVIVTIFDALLKVQELINLGFLSNPKSSLPNASFLVKSPSVLTPVVLDSWMINPFSGFFELDISFGMDNLTL